MRLLSKVLLKRKTGRPALYLNSAEVLMQKWRTLYSVA